jgi:pimeloyl-ACP methyl ester carboxylesterase
VLSRWCDNSGVRLHFFDSGDNGERSRTPLLIVPGWPEAADEYTWLGRRLADRRIVIADVRGRGASDAPARGYTWQHHVSDLEAVVTGAGLLPSVCVAFSRGSSYALGFALGHRDDVRGVVIGDYPAQHVRLTSAFLDRHVRMVVRGVPATERVARHVVERLVAESEDISLWERLRDLDVPVLLIRGGRAGALVDGKREARYREALPTIHVALLERAGHDLWSRDPDAYLEVLQTFLAECDRDRTAGAQQ